VCAAATLLAAACEDAGETIANALDGRSPARGASAPEARVSAVAAGGGVHFASFSHTCAVVDGGLQCWGAGESAQLGDDLGARRSPHPIEVVASGGGVTAVAAGGVHTCAVVNGQAMCWGSNVWAQTGSRRPFIVTAPQRVAGLPGPALRIAAGVHHTCATSGGSLWCWGRNGDGQVGIPSCPGRKPPRKCKADPARVEGLTGEITAFALGRAHSCAVAGGVMQCWGANGRGQLGDGATAARSKPAPVRGISGEVTALAAGGDHTCALAGGDVVCWGANDRGQLGDGTVEDRLEAVASAGLPAEVTALAAGNGHTCAASRRGVHCWGDNREGQLGGAPGAGVNPRPVTVPGVPGDVSALAAGADHVCAVRAGRYVVCWGDNDFGQLGSGDAPADHAEPVSPVAWDDGRIRDRDGDGRITVACLGDSNTQPAPALLRTWCERLLDHLPAERWRTVNRGEGGATAVEFGSLILAGEHLDYALENDAVDAVILAYGTNDLLFAGAAPKDVGHAYSRLRQRARAAGVDVFAALTPPVQPSAQDINPQILELNELLAELFPGSRIIDFWSDMSPEDYVDAVHLGESGHAKRARAAWDALSAAAGPAEAP
jgi:alpha-tubulin suppressor-like RCC1 family protein/lysophospholipase L1-like esterase